MNEHSTPCFSLFPFLYRNRLNFISIPIRHSKSPFLHVLRATSPLPLSFALLFHGTAPTQHRFLSLFSFPLPVTCSMEHTSRAVLCLSPLGSFSFVAYNCFSLSHPSPFLRVAVSSFLLTSRSREEERGNEDGTIFVRPRRH